MEETREQNESAENGRSGKKMLGLFLLPVCAIGAAAIGFAAIAGFMSETDKTPTQIAGAYWNAVAHGQSPDPELADPERAVELGPITTNLRETAKGRFIQIGLTLKTRQSRLEEVNVIKGEIQESLTMFMRGLDGRDLQGAHAMQRFKDQIVRRIALIDAQGKINSVAIHHLVLQ
ncbi:flagellar basal body-associated FliL family protein [Tepidicaulis sp. LMO-SS28]|uniref:flagellar basal body-associated FliL family protein n=1 Tax=Tepidicaulis sp. LMO-SS28 TaxID=3447455 RepID=UPI003EE183AC